jgi:competence protein ComEC
MSKGRSVFILAIFFCLGIILEKALGFSFWFCYVLSLLLFLVILIAAKKGWRSFAVFLCGLIFMLGALSLSSRRLNPRCHISRFLSYKETSYTVKGVVLNEPVLKNDRLFFFLGAEEIRVGELTFRCCGEIRVSLKRAQEISCADELIILGRLTRSFGKWERPDNNGMVVMAPEMPARLLGVRAHSLLLCKRFSIDWKKRIERIIFQNTSPLSAGILDAMLLGEKRYIPPIINNYMVKSGTVHILVVSGFNVGLVSFAVILFLKVLRVGKRMRLLLAIPIICIYCLMTGSSTPVLRATVMAIFFILAALLKREADIYNALGLAVFCILAFNPYQLFDIGFELSFTSVISIVYLFPKLKEWTRVERVKLPCLRVILEGCLVSLSAWLGTSGFIAYYFRIFSPVTVLANLFIVPLATLITLCGFLLAAAHYLLPGLLQPIAATSEMAVALLLYINTILARLPGACFTL